MPHAEMTASASSRPMASLHSDYVLETAAGGLDAQRMFKKHKVLPHPRRDTTPNGMNAVPRYMPRKYELAVHMPQSPKDSNPKVSTESPTASPKRTPGGGPKPPPTPPAHSRNSSSTHSVQPSSPTYVDSPNQSAESVKEQRKQPTTPPNQRSPPTPDETPPGRPPGPAERRPRLRPVINERMPSKATTDSRTESFKTAPENPVSSEDEDEDGRSTLRPVLPSAKTSQDTVRQANSEATIKPQPLGLGLVLESSGGEDNLTPRTRGEFNRFDGEWGSASEVEQEWDDNLMRNVTVKKRRANPQVNGQRDEVVEDVLITPSNAAKGVRSLSLQESPVVYPRRVVSDRVKAQKAPSTSDSSTSTDLRRVSGVSSKSTVSTVVEAILVGTPPRRQRTLRHVKKQTGLRDSSSDLSPSSSAPTSIGLEDHYIPRRQNGRFGEVRHESIASTGTTNSISSRKARREVWRNGGIPVIVVPDRVSSVRTSKTPSLRSTSSRRSKRSQSLGSAPLSQISKTKDLTPYFERPSRRARTMSESDGSRSGDQRTIDFPPVIPKRSSSLSAPTSRNNSRTGSLTAESLHAHNAIHNSMQPRQVINGPRNELAQRPPAVQLVEPRAQGPPKKSNDLPPRRETRPEVTVQRPLSEDSVRLPREIAEPHAVKETAEPHGDRLHVDRNGDPFFGRRLSVQNTPFSQASVETNTTSHAEVSEAMAVNIYPHQNKSVLVVNHSNKPSESSSLDQKQRSTESDLPQINTTDVDATPVTPPQPTFSMDDVDSPLRNPRAPPEPPAIKFIPATPSGLTPAQEKEKQLGNFYEETMERPKTLSLLRRTLSKRRHSEYGPSTSRPSGLLTRTLSLTKNFRRETTDNVTDAREEVRAPSAYPTPDDRPKDENRLHPFWRPASFDFGDEDDFVYDAGEEEAEFRYPPIDNRPPLPRRSLSSRMRRTFAILPVRPDDDDYYPPSASRYGIPDRRTVRRTPSGTLRVIKHRASAEGLDQDADQTYDSRPYTAPDEGARRPFWRRPSLNGKLRRPVANPNYQGIQYTAEDARGGTGGATGKRFLGGKLDSLNLVALQRRMSERRREERNKELRQKISAPREVRDGVGEVIKRNSFR